jgi:hypothetical protein
MMKRHVKLSAAAAAVLLGAVGVLLAIFTVRASVVPQVPPTAVVMPKTVSVSPPVLPSAPLSSPIVSTNAKISTASQTGVLDERRQFALGMIETGNDDREVGGAGEVSRYQIMPVVWHQFSDSQSYRNPSAAQAVARHLWAALYAQFKQQAHREPTDFDMYVLWNTRYGYYARKGFNPARLGPTVRDRAQRFVNLVERADLPMQKTDEAAAAGEKQRQES